MVGLHGLGQAAGGEGALELRAQPVSGDLEDQELNIQPITLLNTRTSSRSSERVGGAMTQEGPWTE